MTKQFALAMLDKALEAIPHAHYEPTRRMLREQAEHWIRTLDLTPEERETYQAKLTALTAAADPATKEP